MSMTAPTRRALLAATAGAAVARSARAEDRAALIDGARREGKMSLATSVSAAAFPRFMQAFTTLYPFLDVTTGYYSAPTGRVLARVDAEMKAGALSFDTLHIASLATYMAYARDGRLLPYRSPELAAYPADAHDDTGTWAIARVVGVIMAYNKNNLAPERAPKSWLDVVRPEFAGRKLITQDAAAGTEFAQIYALERRFGPGYMKQVAAQKPIVVASAAQMIDQLIRGEALLGFTVDHFRAFDPNAVNAGIVGIYPAEGMPIAAAPIAIFKDAPHPNAARLFVDFTLSHEGQTLLNVDIFGVYSARPDVPPPPGQKPYRDTNPLAPDATEMARYEAAFRAFPEHFEALFQ